MFELPDNIIDLDIGGTHKITTTKSTLCSVSNSTLAAMFSGRHRVNMHNGRVFIDRDGEAFCMMINFLRSCKIPMFDSKTKETAFYEELDYWTIPINFYVGENEENSESQTFDS
jgi:predicted ATPase